MILPGASNAADASASQQKAVLDDALQRGDVLWQQIATAEPRPISGCRQLLGYALTLCEARIHPERLERLFALMRQMQDRDPSSKSWGNLKWCWRDAGVTDANAVEFSMQDALLIHIRHGDWLPPVAKKELADLIWLGVEGCLRHRVPTDYTNIAILNAGNLIVLGERLDRADAAREGYRRLDAICAWTAAFGVHEFCSPTYYGTDLSGLLLIQTCARDKRQRRQADALLQLFWTDIAANWFPAAQRLGGCPSRSYDYLRGLGGLDWHLWMHGWLESQSPGSAERREPWTREWSPPPALKEMSRQFPRWVRQHWGILPAQCRSQMLYRDIALSCCGAGYGNQDSTLVVDLPGSRELSRCYFIPDGREDPYGKKKYETGSARHPKALHIQPFWAGAQRSGDALGLVIYRGRDMADAEVFHVQSHFVLRRTPDLWLDGKRLTMPVGTAEKPAEVPIPIGSSLVLRYGGAAVGVRVPGSYIPSKRLAIVSLLDDGNAWNSLRLTVDHGLSADLEKTAAGEIAASTAFWVRVGSQLTRDADFDAWRKDFDQVKEHWYNVDDRARSVSVGVSGKDGPLSIRAVTPWDETSRVRLVPNPYQGVLEVNGKELGLPLLIAVEPLSLLPPGTGPLSCRTVPAGKAFYWEAESGLVLPGMAVGEDAEASGGRYVGQGASPLGQPSGSVTWKLVIEKTGRYWFWARVRSTSAHHGAFSFQVIGEDGAIMPTATWLLRSPGKWQWQPLEFKGAKSPTPLDLTKGIYYIQLQARQSGTMIDQLMLTADRP
ncbi:MAG: hypothetical protein WCJ35_22380 [Planctomycetota bacterium]